MAKFTFNLPDIGEGIAEAEIVAWHVKVGDQVEEDGRLADMMTDKATVEMESPVAGRIVQVAGEEGDVIAIGSPLVVIETDAEIPMDAVEEAPAPKAEVVEERIEVETSDAGDVEDAVEAAPASPPPPAEPESETSARPELVEGRAATPANRTSTGSVGADHGAASKKVLASPAVRARATELGIDLGEVRPAEDGRIRHADLDAFLSYGGAKGYAPAGKRLRDESIKVIGLRRRIAENMAASKRNIPHFSYVEECDVTEL
jgi:2-oxoisovalerate dehydrogenase E2 component (dihydrolipoyl transacylase)